MYVIIPIKNDSPSGWHLKPIICSNVEHIARWIDADVAVDREEEVAEGYVEAVERALVENGITSYAKNLQYHYWAGGEGSKHNENKEYYLNNGGSAETWNALTDALHDAVCWANEIASDYAEENDLCS